MIDMLVTCPDPSCNRRVGVSLGSAVNREETSGLHLLAQTCARCRVNGVADCKAAQMYAAMKAESLLHSRQSDFEAA